MSTTLAFERTVESQDIGGALREWVDDCVLHELEQQITEGIRPAWQSPMLTQIRVSAEVTAYVAIWE